MGRAALGHLGIILPPMTGAVNNFSQSLAGRQQGTGDRWVAALDSDSASDRWSSSGIGVFLQVDGRTGFQGCGCHRVI
jgi:hypothetical protein